MAIPKMEDDVEVISKLGDTPGSDDGLTPQQLKSRFDLAGVRIKNFINNILVPHMNQLIDVQSLLDGILDSTLSLPDKAANAKTTGEKIAEVLRIANGALQRTGGYLSGAVNMNNQQLAGLPTPTTATSAVPKNYVDTVTDTVTLSKDGWIGEEAPYYQTVTASHLTDAKIAHGYPVYTGVFDDDLEIQKACACISYAERTGSSVTFHCLEFKPEYDITVKVEVGV